MRAGSALPYSKEKSEVKRKIICLILAALFILSGCSTVPGGTDSGKTAQLVPDPTQAASEATTEPETEPAVTQEPAATEEPVPEATPDPDVYEYNPHLYVPMLIKDIPQDYWDSFHNLCDALRMGDDTFACVSEEAYKWATDPSVLTQLFPAAVLRIRQEGKDGSKRFENGIGRIYYQNITPDEYVVRQKRFEEEIASLLNSILDADDDDFEKALKLYLYISETYVYEYDFQEERDDGSIYYALTKKTGQCVDLGGMYAFLLLQAGVQACAVDGSGTMDHAWTYLLINGKGYHSDPTWGLQATNGGHETLMNWFLMDKETRGGGDDFDMDDLMVALLPRYWLQYSETKELPAENCELSFPRGSFFQSLDEENKIAYYDLDGEKGEIRYGLK